MKRRNVQEAFVGEPTGDPAQSLDNYAEGDEAVDVEVRGGKVQLIVPAGTRKTISFADLVAEAAAVPPGSDGLVLLPYFAGERTPIFDAQARGVIAGLSLRHTRAHLFRAVYEGIAFGIRQILEFLEHDADPATRLVAVGGGTQGGLWTQIVSDVSGRTQQLPAQTIGASYGDALLAAVGTGLVPASADWSTIDRQVSPNPQTRKVYDPLYEIYCSLYPATRDQVHALARMQESVANGQ